MATSSQTTPNLVKILISYQEYTRLKDIETKYIESQKHLKRQLNIQEGKKL